MPDVSDPTPRHRTLRAFEMIVLFAIVPLILAIWRVWPQEIADLWAAVGVQASFLAKPSRFMLPSLMLFTLVCLALLWRDQDFDRKKLWNAKAAGRDAPKLLLTFLPAAGFLTILAWQLSPGSWLLSTAYSLGLPPRWLPGMASLFRLPRERPELWVMIMLLYPLLSVWPQEVLYRAFFFHRYGALLVSPAARIAASAAAFGFMHILFLNPVAPLLCLVGGVLFAVTYERTKSVLAASVEHSMYGCWIFTVGLGPYFFGGTVYTQASS